LALLDVYPTAHFSSEAMHKPSPLFFGVSPVHYVKIQNPKMFLLYPDAHALQSKFLSSVLLDAYPILQGASAAIQSPSPSCFGRGSTHEIFTHLPKIFVYPVSQALQSKSGFY
jgi:hypothetical protein